MTNEEAKMVALRVVCYCISHHVSTVKMMGMTFFTLSIGMGEHATLQISAYRDMETEPCLVVDLYHHMGFGVAINRTAEVLI